ncbi:autotransporter outer membrane beta-barrel domain-containing protein, partial [Klebsiella pneumoniae]|nr:autotransporter outer membrane beta-barrel domain-containing protein [Klebsiella pneumoniae]
YEFAFPTWYVKPYADFDLLYTYMPAYSTEGADVVLDYASAQQWNVAFSPNVEIGGRFDLSPSLWLRPYGTVGMTFFAKDSMPVGVSLSDAS